MPSAASFLSSRNLPTWSPRSQQIRAPRMFQRRRMRRSMSRAMQMLLFFQLPSTLWTLTNPEQHSPWSRHAPSDLAIQCTLYRCIGPFHSFTLPTVLYWTTQNVRARWRFSCGMSSAIIALCWKRLANRMLCGYWISCSHLVSATFLLRP
jgi:hypothetical protein